VSLAVLIFAILYQQLVLLGLIVFSAYRLIVFWSESEEGIEWRYWWNGKMGEYGTKRRLKALLADGRGGYFLHDVYLPLGDGLTQIDFILFHLNGVFVIETKYWDGALYGAATDVTWTLKRGGRQSSPYNPIRQNAAHVDAVRNVLGNGVHVVGLVHLMGVTVERSLPASVVVSPLPLRPAINHLGPHPLYSLEQLAQFRDAVLRADPCVADPSLKVVHRVRARVSKLTRERADRLGVVKIAAPLPQAPVKVSAPQAAIPCVEPLGSIAVVPERCPNCGATMTLRQARKGPRVGKMGYACDNFCGRWVNVD
jgi:hypothetical protein